MFLFYELSVFKKGTLFKGGHYSREDIIQGNTVFVPTRVNAATAVLGLVFLSLIWKLQNQSGFISRKKTSSLYFHG